ncbi:hypothetical protein lerEdw1_009734, partial [Lerista edwardsae]
AETQDLTQDLLQWRCHIPSWILGGHFTWYQPITQNCPLRLTIFFNSFIFADATTSWRASTPSWRASTPSWRASTTSWRDAATSWRVCRLGALIRMS